MALDAQDRWRVPDHLVRIATKKVMGRMLIPQARILGWVAFPFSRPEPSAKRPGS